LNKRDFSSVTVLSKTKENAANALWPKKVTTILGRALVQFSAAKKSEADRLIDHSAGGCPAFFRHVPQLAKKLSCNSFVHGDLVAAKNLQRRPGVA
jgi:hypothetical protein